MFNKEKFKTKQQQQQQNPQEVHGLKHSKPCEWSVEMQNTCS